LGDHGFAADLRRERFRPAADRPRRDCDRGNAVRVSHRDVQGKAAGRILGPGLALPVLPSLQFVLGYPLRVVSAAITVTRLQSHGFLVERQGTFLAWRDEVIQFDAACSGVNMLWAGLLLTLMGCVLFRLRALQVTIAVLLSIIVAVAANVLRTSSLFYLEAGLIPWAAAPWWHEAIGIAAFVVSAAMILWLLRRLRDWEMAAWA
jgi:exosortase/archaeosortase family protein